MDAARAWPATQVVLAAAAAAAAHAPIAPSGVHSAVEWQCGSGARSKLPLAAPAFSAAQVDSEVAVAADDQADTDDEEADGLAGEWRLRGAHTLACLPPLICSSSEWRDTNHHRLVNVSRAVRLGWPWQGRRQPRHRGPRQHAHLLLSDMPFLLASWLPHPLLSGIISASATRTREHPITTRSPQPELRLGNFFAVWVPPTGAEVNIVHLSVGPQGKQQQGEWLCRTPERFHRSHPQPSVRVA